MQLPLRGTIVHEVTPKESSALRQLVEIKLGQPLGKWVVTAKLKNASSRKRARRIEEETGIKVGKSTVHRWFNE